MSSKLHKLLLRKEKNDEWIEFSYWNISYRKLYFNREENYDISVLNYVDKMTFNADYANNNCSLLYF